MEVKFNPANVEVGKFVRIYATETKRGKIIVDRAEEGLTRFTFISKDGTFTQTKYTDGQGRVSFDDPSGGEDPREKGSIVKEGV